ncbi:MAG: sulfate reduction electron transfer complex DsrMKJOP subunit DsrK [Desulfurella sp.]|uniref:sulfate reduction electron transfer complex DsrMKJOP subunit DsrK n=1 Tax=Desulfurella sp. TaxID=1962857 RepID=UPI003D0D82FE
MSKEHYHIHKLTGKIQTPKLLRKGNQASEFTFLALEEDMETLGFPKKLQEGWQDKAVGVFKELLDNNKALKTYMDICVRCGACTDKCQFFLGSGDINNTPVGRAELMRKVYRYYFTPFSSKGEPFSEHVLKQWMSYFYQCSECRRCSYFCPYGIDTAEITMAAREIMDSIGVGEKYATNTITQVYRTGNNIGIDANALKNTIAEFEEDLKDETGKDIKIPIDEEGAEVLLVPPSADFFAIPHIESMFGYAKVFYKAGISYTLSSYASEAANFGMFIGSYTNTKEINKRIWEEARRLKVKRVIIGECGHAWRAAYNYSNTMNGPFDFLDPKYPQPSHICDFTLGLIRDGVIKIDKSANDDKIVTYHDPCNVARASRMGTQPGDQFSIPRDLIKSVCNNFVDMQEGAIKAKTFCCGAGAGLLTDEIMQTRINGVMPRMQAFKEVVDKNNVNFFATICAICKTQFYAMFPLYGFERDWVGGIHQLVSAAIVL